MISYLHALLGIPAMRVGLVISLVLSAFLAGPIARRLGWSTSGTALALASLGGTISVTLFNRLGRKDLVWDPEAVSECLSWTTRSWTAPEALLNMVLLLPLGFGIFLASRSAGLGVSVVLVTAILIESLQAVLGLGQCQPSDVIRNSVGGVAGVLLGWLVARFPNIGYGGEHGGEHGGGR